MEGITIDELKRKVLRLKTSSYSYIVDDAIRKNIEKAIMNLPSSEEIDGISDDFNSQQKITNYIEDILELIEIGSQRDEDFKVRNEVIKDLPPRHQIIKWESKMSKNEIVMDLLKFSKKCEDLNEDYIAEKSIELIEKINDGKASLEDVNNIEKYCSNNKILKEAQPSTWQNVKDFFTGGPGKKERVNYERQQEKNQQSVKKINDNTYAVLQYISQMPSQNEYDVSKIENYLKQTNIDPNVNQLLNNYIEQINQFQNGFYQMIDSMAQDSENAINVYKESGYTSFEGINQEKQSQPEMVEQSEDSSQTEFETNEIVYDTNINENAKVIQILDNGKILLEYEDGSQTEQFPEYLKKSSKTNKKNIKLSSRNKKWVRVV